MGKLAEIAKAAKGLKGPVTISFLNGTQRTFKNEAEAETACAGLDLEHKRGAFFEKAKAPEEIPAPKTTAKMKKA